MRQGTIIITLLIVAVVAFILISKSSSPQPSPTNSPTPTASSSMSKTYSQPPAMQLDPQAKYTATVTTSAGVLTIDLFASEVPATVNNFVFLSNEKFYDGTKFHRIIKDFMIQGGDPKGNGTGGPGYSFADEPITRSYTRGTVAMANSGPNTNGSQFFIMTRDTPLPKLYVIFGELSGDTSFKTLDAIASTPVTSNPTGESSQPTQNVTITNIIIDKQ